MATLKVTDDMVEQAIAETDWAVIDAMTDADIERQIEENPDAAPDLAREAAVRAWNETTAPVAGRIRAVRKALGMSRPEFSRAYGLSLRTLEGWEQGIRQPDPNAAALLTLIAHMPARARAILEPAADKAA